jgi:hypothetical protein
MPGQIPEFVMSMLHACIVQQVAAATFQDGSSSAVAGSQQQGGPATTAAGSAALARPAALAAAAPLCASADRAAEFYQRLESMGFTIGLRIAERLLATQLATTHASERPQDDAVHLIRTVLWPALYGKELMKEVDPPPQQNQQQPAAAPWKLLDPDFSWTRSVALPPDSSSLADPFLRAPQTDVLEEADDFLKAVNKKNQTSQKPQQQQQQPQSSSSLDAGPNDYVVVLTGLVLGFLSSLGFGSHAERRVFGGDRTTITAITPQMQQVIATPPASEGSLVGGTNAVVARPPGSFVTVRHRLAGRDGDAAKPCSMQLKLVIYFS